MPDRVLIVTERFWPEEFLVNDLARALVARGDAVTVLTQQPSYPAGRLAPGRRNRWWARETWEGVEILRIRTVLGYRESLVKKLAAYAWFAVAGSLAALLRAPRAGVLFVFQTGPLTAAVPAVLLARLRRTPLALWVQDVWPDTVYDYGFRRTAFRAACLDAFCGWVYRSASAVLVSSRGFAPVVARFTGRAPAYVPNWPMTPHAPGAAGRDAGAPPVFLFAGNVGTVQNLEHVVRGYARARRADPGVGVLRIAGDGSALDAIRRVAEAEGAPVEFRGRLPAAAMGAEYDHADVLVLSLADRPVFRLTVPSKFQQYLSVGKPILCAAAGEIARLVRERNVGVVADPGDPDAIARGFRAMRDADPAAAAAWAANARTLLREEFDRDALLAGIGRTLSGLAAGVRTA